MKPLLRAVLIVDAGLYLSSGAVLLLTPLAGLQRALQITTIEPAMAGQMLGLALLGLAWMSLRGAVDGAMTVSVAKIVGHVTWLAGALVLAWTIGPHVLWLPALGIVPNMLIGGLLVVVGLGGARFAQAVRRREIAKAAQARGDSAKTRSVAAASAAPAAVSEPVEPVLRPAGPYVVKEPGAASLRGGPSESRVAPAIDTPSPSPSSPASRALDESSDPSRARAASGSGDLHSTQPGSTPRPPFHG